MLPGLFKCLDGLRASNLGFIWDLPVLRSFVEQFVHVLIHSQAMDYNGFLKLLKRVTKDFFTFYNV